MGFRSCRGGSYVFFLLVAVVRWRSSRSSSVSLEFWISVRFCSSSSVSRSRSCSGSVKYSSGSSYRGIGGRVTPL